MAYQTGVVNNLVDIQTAIRLFLVANGWTWSGGGGGPVLHKDQIFVKFITPTADTVMFVGTTALSGGSDTPRQVGMGRMVYSGIGNVPALITFPATYWAFLNDDEFYFILNYDTTRYQFVTWGKSTLDVGAGATGMFIAGTVNELLTYGGYTNISAGITISANGGGLSSLHSRRSAAPFWDSSQNANSTSMSSYTDLTASFVHSNLGGASWRLGVQPSNDATRWDYPGNGYAGNLQSVLPNAWNGESPFLPLRAYRLVAETKISLVLDLRHARQCRIDNFSDNEIVTIGTDEWQVFPFHRRNVVARNGGSSIDHTGTFGWAIRKVT